MPIAEVKAICANQGTENSLEIAFPEENTDNKSFLCIYHIDESSKQILVFAGVDAESMLNDDKISFSNGTFESFPKQFA